MVWGPTSEARGLFLAFKKVKIKLPKTENFPTKGKNKKKKPSLSLVEGIQPRWRPQTATPLTVPKQ